MILLVRGYALNYQLRGEINNTGGISQAAKQNELLFSDLIKKKNVAHASLIIFLKSISLNRN